jgi:5-bromo-4-chloroindolyl phosphate hydrolysis protein
MHTYRHTSIYTDTHIVMCILIHIFICIYIYKHILIHIIILVSEELEKAEGLEQRTGTYINT